jgi:hypothetical protein
MAKPDSILPIILTMIFLIAMGYEISGDIAPQPYPQEVTASSSEQIKAVLSKYYQLQQHTFYCKPNTDVKVLAEILIDSPDYYSNQYDVARIQHFFGAEGMAHPGFLTSRQAYYLSVQRPIPTTYPPGQATPRPTPRPAISISATYCSDGPAEININLESISQLSDGRWIVQYEHDYAGWEATLRYVDSAWRISGMRLIYGGRG